MNIILKKQLIDLTNTELNELIEQIDNGVHTFLFYLGNISKASKALDIQGQIIDILMERKGIKL